MTASPFRDRAVRVRVMEETMSSKLVAALVLVGGSCWLVAGAEAISVCQKKSGAVFLRDACKKRETQVDLPPLVGVTRDAEGDIGIGTTDPIAKLEAANTGATEIGVLGTSESRGVVGRIGTGTSCPGTYGVGGCTGSNPGDGVLGSSDTGSGVIGSSNSGPGVAGTSSSGPGLSGSSSTNNGVSGSSESGQGISGTSNSGRGVFGTSTSGIGVFGNSGTRGVVGTLGGTPCAGTYGAGGCGGTTGDGLVGRSSVPASSFSAAGVHAFNDAGGDIFIGEASGARRARIDGSGTGFFDGGTQASGADYADSMPTSDDPAKLEPGDVLAIDARHGFALRQSREPNSPFVAGVYSTKPSILGVGEHRIDDPRSGEVPVALVGVVPTKVTAENGPIRPGDLLVTSSAPGRAMKAKTEVAGAVLGKALEPLERGTGTIKVLVTLR